jgi:hypothetical protein
MKKAQDRIEIRKFLEKAGWRYLDCDSSHNSSVILINRGFPVNHGILLHLA